jgi:DASH complex subunit Dad2
MLRERQGGWGDTYFELVEGRVVLVDHRRHTQRVLLCAEAVLPKMVMAKSSWDDLRGLSLRVLDVFSQLSTKEVSIATNMQTYVRPTKRVSPPTNVPTPPPPSPPSSLRCLFGMSLSNRPFRTSMYDANTQNTHTASTASNPPPRFLPNHILTSRIAEKQAEYENLVQLRDLSAALATQMEGLEAKLQCLADGTESTPHTNPLPLVRLAGVVFVG